MAWHGVSRTKNETFQNSNAYSVQGGRHQINKQQVSLIKIRFPDARRKKGGKGGENA